MPLALAELPTWPVMMSAEVGGAYVGMGHDAFRTLMAKHGVLPRDLGNTRVLWRKADVDRVIDNLPARSNMPAGAAAPPLAIVPLDPAAAALERVRAQAGKRDRKG